MTTYEDIHNLQNNLTPKPLEIIIPRKFQQGAGYITAIRVRDIARNIWYSWDNGVWDNAGGSGNNAPVGETPIVTPGSGNLYFAFWITVEPMYVNGVTYSQTETLKLIDTASGAVLAQTTQTVSSASGQGAGVQWTGNMPSNNYSLTLRVTP